jgi:hypothetical protein
MHMQLISVLFQVAGSSDSSGALSNRNSGTELQRLETEPHDLDLLNDTNFGAGRKSTLVQIHEALLSPLSNQDRVNLLASFGAVTSTDTHVRTAMLDFTFSEWEKFASSLLQAEIVPGQPLLLKVDLSEEHRQQPEGDSGKLMRIGPAELSRTVVRFNQIVSESQGNSEFRFERVPDCVNHVLLRDQGMIQTESGGQSTLCSAILADMKNKTRVDVVLKLRHDLNLKVATASTEHELQMLNYFRNVSGVPKLQGQGAVDNRRVLVMQKECNNLGDLETLSVNGFYSVTTALLSILKKVNNFGIVHGNVSPNHLLYDAVAGNLVLSSFQYASMDPDAEEATRTKCINSGLKAQSPLKANSINIATLDSAPKTKTFDSFCAGASILCLLMRNTSAFSKKRKFDLSSLANLSQQELASIVSEGIKTFNSFIDPRSERLDRTSEVVRLVCGLLHGDQELRFTCSYGLDIIRGLRRNSQQKIPDSIIIPAKFIFHLNEMKRASKIVICSDSVDRQGKSTQGRKLVCFGGARAGDLLETYAGQVRSKSDGDGLTVKGLGSNLKSIVIGGRQMVLDARYQGNGFVDLFYLGSNGAAGLANGNASVEVRRDGKGGNVMTVKRFPANSYFEVAKLSQPYRLAVPGNYLTNEIITLRAARDILDGEDIFVDYGPGTMKKMFGLCSGKLAINKPDTKKTKASQQKKRRIMAAVKDSATAQLKRQRGSV